MAYGWTGKVVTGRTCRRASSPRKTRSRSIRTFLGGTGLAYKVLWDEVPPGTKAWDPENRIIFGVGPLTGTGTPLFRPRLGDLPVADAPG